MVERGLGVKDNGTVNEVFEEGLRVEDNDFVSGVRS